MTLNLFTATVQRRIASLVLVTFTSLTLQPLQAAVMADQQKKAAIAASQAPAPQSPVTQNKDELYGKGLDNLRELLERAKTKQSRGERDDAEVSQLRTTKLELEADFTATEQHLKDHKLPPQILARHLAAVKEFKTKQSELKQKLKAVEDAHDRASANYKVDSVCKNDVT